MIELAISEDFVYHAVVISITALCILIPLFLMKRFLFITRYKGNARIDGKTVIITGANSGIGKEVAKDLAKRGGRIILACRYLESATNAAEEIRRNTVTHCDVIVRHLDLASLSSVRKFASEIIDTEKRLDILINNAGVFFCPFRKTEDGFEMQFGVNHLGHFLLTNLLLDLLKKSAPSRIITVSSHLYPQGTDDFMHINSEETYGRLKNYIQSKFANVLFNKELARRLKGTGVATYALEPGISRTNLGRYLWQQAVVLRPILFLYQILPLFGGAKEGAQTIIYCAVEKLLENETGKFYSNCQEKTLEKQALIDSTAKRVWQLSEQMVGLGIDRTI